MLPDKVDGEHVKSQVSHGDGLPIVVSEAGMTLHGCPRLTSLARARADSRPRLQAVKQWCSGALWPTGVPWVKATAEWRHGHAPVRERVHALRSPEMEPGLATLAQGCEELAYSPGAGGQTVALSGCFIWTRDPAGGSLRNVA